MGGSGSRDLQSGHRAQRDYLVSMKSPMKGEGMESGGIELAERKPNREARTGPSKVIMAKRGPVEWSWANVEETQLRAARASNTWSGLNSHCNATKRMLMAMVRSEFLHRGRKARLTLE
jgi:hypothetical protein